MLTTQKVKNKKTLQKLNNNNTWLVSLLWDMYSPADNNIIKY